MKSLYAVLIFFTLPFVASVAHAEEATAYPRDNDDDYTESYYHFEAKKPAKPAAKAPATAKQAAPEKVKEAVPVYPQDNDQIHEYQQPYHPPQQAAPQPEYAAPKEPVHDPYSSTPPTENRYPADNDSDYKPPAQTQDNPDNFYPAYY